MNWRTFLAMLGRDAHVARRHLVQLAFQTLLQPMLFVFIFGRVMTGGGLLPARYKSLLLPGIMSISMILSGIWAVAMPLLSEFQFTREIEDRLLAPMEIEWLAVEKVVAGTIQALIAGLVVLPIGRLIMGRGVEISLAAPFTFILMALLAATMAAAIGLTLGCTVSQQGIGLMFSLVVTPMIFFGCNYYPWSTLAGFPFLQRLVLANPMVYASEGFRGARTAVSAPASNGGGRRPGRVRRCISRARAATVPAQGGQPGARLDAGVWSLSSAKGCKMPGVVSAGHPTASVVVAQSELVSSGGPAAG